MGYIHTLFQFCIVKGGISMHFNLRFLNRNIHLIISFCILLSGCSQKVEKISQTIDELPQAQVIIKDLKENSLNKKHPRLMATNDDFKRIKTELKNDENLKRWYKSLEVETDKILREPVVKYEISDGMRLLPISRKVLNRTISLALMYRLTGNDKYADRAWKELSVVSDNVQFPNWNPTHFLDTAEMTNAVAIGYDWLYDYLSVGQRQILRKALIEKGLKPALLVYRGTVATNKDTNFWRDTTNNWNTVSNAGIGMGALAIADESPEIEDLSGEILQYAIESIKNSLSVYGPDGGTPEGPTYWVYATSYMAYFLSSLDSALGTDYGLSKLEGLSQTGYYPIYVEGTKGSFNVGDAGIDIISTVPQMFWFSNKYQNPDFFGFALRGNHPLNLIWYRKQKVKNSFIEDLPLDRRFLNSETGLVTMRSKWDSNAFFVGVHAGDNQASHGDLDIGSFVLDTLGIRWAYDLGADNYDLPGYFHTDSRRWTYYRKRAEGQNTLVINPGNKVDQNINARATIKGFNSTSQQGFTIIDMTSAYERDALSVKRGIALADKRSTVVIQDELKLKAPSDVYWFMHTQAKIELSKDKKTAALTLAGKRIYAHIVSPIEGNFEIMEAKPLPVSPNPMGQNPNKGIQKLAIHLNAISSTTLSVVFVRDSSNGKNKVDWPQPFSLDNWGTSGILNSD